MSNARTFNSRRRRILPLVVLPAMILAGCAPNPAPGPPSTAASTAGPTAISVAPGALKHHGSTVNHASAGDTGPGTASDSDAQFPADTQPTPTHKPSAAEKALASLS